MTGNAIGCLLPHKLVGAERRAVVLVNSIGMTWELWDPQAAILESAGYRVLRFNQRGHRGAPTPPPPYSIEDLGGDLIALLDSLEIDEAAICGLSLGGMVALWVAAHHSERVSVLVAACTSALPGAPEKWAQRAARARREGLEPIALQGSRNWFSQAFAEGHPEVLAGFRHIYSANPPEGYAGCCAVIQGLDLRPDLHRISAPTTVVVGELDGSFPLAHGEVIRAGIRGAGIVEIVGAAHLANVECPDRFNEILLGALSAGEE